MEREVQLAVRESPCSVSPPSLWLTGRKRQYRQQLRSQGFESPACFDHLLISHTYSRLMGRRIWPAVRDYGRVALREQSEPEGLWKVGFVRCPLIPMGGCHWLV